jgi:hypothetical protein
MKFSWIRDEIFPDPQHCYLMIAGEVGVKINDDAALIVLSHGPQ